MCLSVIDKDIKNPNTLIQSGWKNFSGTHSQPIFETCKFADSYTVPLDKWITAEGDKIKAGWRSDYKAGFHIYEDEMELSTTKRINKRRVYFRRVHTRGSQNKVTVVVALEMYVPSNPDEWPPQ